MKDEGVTKSVRSWYEVACRSKRVPLAGYFVPGRDGMGVWPNSKIVRSAQATFR